MTSLHRAAQQVLAENRRVMLPPHPLGFGGGRYNFPPSAFSARMLRGFLSQIFITYLSFFVEAVFSFYVSSKRILCLGFFGKISSFTHLN